MKRAANFLMILFLLLHLTNNKNSKKTSYNIQILKNKIREKLKDHPLLTFVIGFTFSMIRELNPDLIDTELIKMKDIQCFVNFIDKFWTFFVNNSQAKNIRNEMIKVIQMNKINSTFPITYLFIFRNIIKLTSLLWKEPFVKALVEVVKCTCKTTGNILSKTFAISQLLEDKNFSIFLQINFFQMPKILYNLISTTYSIYKIYHEKKSVTWWNLMGKTMGKFSGLVFKTVRMLYL